MPKSALSLSLESRRGTARYIDLSSEIVHVSNKWWDKRGHDGVGDTVLEVGGKWDRRRGRWHSEADRRRQIFVHDGQVEAAYFMRDWLTRFVADGELSPPVYTMMLGGPRRSAKSHLGFNFAAAVFPIAVKNAKVWIVTPEHEQDEGDEVQLTVRSTIPASWYEWKGNPKRVFTIHNRSKIWLRSARSNLKKGGADLILLNEAQRMPVRAYNQSRGAVVDNGGIVMPIANPPDEEEFAGGDWVDDLVDGVAGGKRPNAKVFHFRYQLNPEIDQAAMEALDNDITDADTLLRDKGGAFGLRRNRALHNFSSLNIGPVPELGNVTRAVLKKHFHLSRHDKYILCDFQLTPHQAALVCEFFVNPDDPNDPDLWVTDYVLVANGDEDDLIDALESQGYSGDHCVVVADASGDWQFSDRKKMRTPGYSGSHDMFRRRRWRFIYPPDSKMRSNPHILPRMAAANARLCDHNKVRHVYVAEHLAPVIEAFKKWPKKNGVPSRRSKYAHLGDCLGYGCWRLYPRAAKRGRVEFESVGKRTRRDDFEVL